VGFRSMVLSADRPAVEETGINLLFVCTAGRCRSPMAAALLEQHLRDLGSRVTVASGGLKFTGERMPPRGVSMMARYGTDLSGHIGIPVTERSVSEADIILGMTREHVREIVAISPDAWAKTFTLKEFVRRAERAGARHRHQRVSDWLVNVGAGREPQHVLGSDSGDDIIDPFGRRRSVWKHVIADMDDLVSRIIPTLGLSRPVEPAPPLINGIEARQRHRRILGLGKRSQVEWATTDAAGARS
jgi:protein-tyrosine phosphatase